MKRPSIKILVVFTLYLIAAKPGFAQDITTGLVAHFKFEIIASGNIAIDETGNNTGEIIGPTIDNSGHDGNAFSFDGSNDHVRIPDSPTLNPADFTLSYWVKSNGPQGNYDRVSGFDGFDYEVAVGGSTNSLLIYPGTWIDTNYDVTPGTWTLIVSSYSHTTNTWHVYANNTLVYSGVRTRTLSGDLYIGSKYSVGECFDGSIDDVRLYNRALTAADVQELYSPGGGSTPTLSVNNISVNEGDGTATFTISMNQTSTQTVSGQYTTTSGTATSGSDYTAKSGTFEISTGQTTTVSVSITDDATVEGSETFNLTISNPTNASIDDATGVCTIIDNDIAGLSCSNTISNFPYSEGFEDVSNTWENTTGDDINWTRKSGSTSSGSTGPTSAQEGDIYNYIEATNNFSKTAILNGPCFDLNGACSAELTFYYHMYGAAMGTLKLESSTDGTNWVSLWSLTGDQGNSWQLATVNLSIYLGSTVKLRFHGTTGSSFTSDMSVDNLSLTTTGGDVSTLWTEHTNGTDIYYTSGKVGIGTESPDELLTVNGTIHSQEVIVETDIPAPDYVFEDQYELRSIKALDKYLKKNNHLPDIPSAQEMESKGVRLAELNLMLLKQIEELTLYIIDQEKRIVEIESGQSKRIKR